MLLKAHNINSLNVFTQKNFRDKWITEMEMTWVTLTAC